MSITDASQKLSLKMDSLQEKIIILLNEEKRAYKANGRIRGGLGSFNISIQQPGWSNGEIPQLLKQISDSNAIKSRNADILIKLWTTLNLQDKEGFQSFLLSTLSKDSIYHDTAYLIFFVLSKIGLTIQALKIAQTKLRGDQSHGFSNMLAMLSQMISYSYRSFDVGIYNEIENVMQNESEYNFNILEKTNAAKLIILEESLADVNPEINYDKDRILSLWDRIFTSSEVSSVIKEIEQYFNEGEFTETKFATCIGRVRVLVVDVTRTIAYEISSKKGDNKIDIGSDEHRVFDYLRTIKFVDDDQWNLMRALYGMSSDTGSHSSIAPREYARLTKNMAYEIILMLLTKYKKGDSDLFIDK